MTVLDDYRKELDRIDESMTKLLEERMRTVEKIATYKHEHHVPVLDAIREREILDRITKEAAPDMAYYTRTMYSNIMEMSKDHQRKSVQEDTALVKKIKKAMEETPKVFPKTATIACAGVLGAYAQQACDKLFQMPQSTPKPSTSSSSTGFNPGDRVSHPKFGEGTVISVTPFERDSLMEIDFGAEGKKRLMAAYAKLKKI